MDGWMDGWMGFELPIQKILSQLEKIDHISFRRTIMAACVSQFNQRVKKLGSSGNINLRWVKQPDGKIFHREEEEKEDL